MYSNDETKLAFMHLVYSMTEKALSCIKSDNEKARELCIDFIEVQLLSHNIIDCLILFLDKKTPVKLLFVSLNIIKNLLLEYETNYRFNRADNELKNEFEQKGGVELLEDLNDHRNESIYKISVEIFTGLNDCELKGLKKDQ